MVMNRLSCGILGAIQLMGTWMAVAQTETGPGVERRAPIVRADMNQATVPGTDGSCPAISISARNLDFGAVPVGSNHELSFRIRNVGASALTAKASVSPPFSILGGGAFVLEPTQTRLITVQYAPTSAGMNMTVVHLTGTTITVTGSAAAPVTKAPARRRRAPTHPDGQRLIAVR